MGLHCFQDTGFNIDYFPSLLGNHDHITIELSYLDNGISLLNNQSLIKLRDWLFMRNVSSVEFNIFGSSQRYNQDKLQTFQYRQLAKKLGALILGVSTIKEIYIDAELQSDDRLQPYKDAFKTTLTQTLETSLAHPSLFMNVSSGYLGGPPSYTTQTFLVDYPDKRTFGQKFYNFTCLCSLLI